MRQLTLFADSVQFSSLKLKLPADSTRVLLILGGPIVAFTESLLS